MSKRPPPHPLYRRWNWICQVTTNTNDPNWPGYGGKGVKNQFGSWTEFRDYIENELGLPKPPFNKLNRIDQEGDYAPGNLRWTDTKGVGRNMPRNARVTYGGESLTCVEWAERLGLNYHTVFERAKHNWAPEQILGLEPPPRFANRRAN
jgi:hypothetical protein